MDDPLLRLGQFAHALTWDGVPTETRTRANLALRDTIGTMLGGAFTVAGRLATATAVSGAGSSLIPGGGGRATSVLAAFAGAVNASALDFDDGHYSGGAIHPSSVIVPTLLVAAQAEPGIDRQAFLTAQVVGYEIGLRAGHLLWPRHELADYHCTGTAAALGAAAAVATLRGGDADVIARSVAIAWAHAPMSTFQLPMVKESIGWSAATALFAADLARGGFMRLTGPDGSALAVTFPPTPFHRAGAMDDPFVASLGSVFETAHTYFKPYASCRYTHTALRSMAALMHSHGLVAADVASVVVFTPKASKNLTDQQPASLDHAQYSFPFVLATMLLTGAAGAGGICEAALGEPARLALAARIVVQHDPSLDATYPARYATRLEVTCIDGRVHDITRLIAPGDPDDPMTEQQLAAKFIALAAPVHGASAAAAMAVELVDPTGELATVMAAALPT